MGWNMKIIRVSRIVTALQYDGTLGLQSQDSSWKWLWSIKNVNISHQAYLPLQFHGVIMSTSLKIHTLYSFIPLSQNNFFFQLHLSSQLFWQSKKVLPEFLTVGCLHSVPTSQASFLWRLCHGGDIPRLSHLRQRFTNTPCERLRSSDVTLVDCLDNELPRTRLTWKKTFKEVMEYER